MGSIDDRHHQLDDHHWFSDLPFYLMEFVKCLPFHIVSYWITNIGIEGVFIVDDIDFHDYWDHQLCWLGGNFLFTIILMVSVTLRAALIFKTYYYRSKKEYNSNKKNVKLLTKMISTTMRSSGGYCCCGLSFMMVQNIIYLVDTIMIVSLHIIGGKSGTIRSFFSIFMQYCDYSSHNEEEDHRNDSVNDKNNNNNVEIRDVLTMCYITIVLLTNFVNAVMMSCRMFNIHCFLITEVFDNGRWYSWIFAPHLRYVIDQLFYWPEIIAKCNFVEFIQSDRGRKELRHLDQERTIKLWCRTIEFHTKNPFTCNYNSNDCEGKQENFKVMEEEEMILKKNQLLNLLLEVRSDVLGYLFASDNGLLYTYLLDERVYTLLHYVIYKMAHSRMSSYQKILTKMMKSDVGKQVIKDTCTKVNLKSYYGGQTFLNFVIEKNWSLSILQEVYNMCPNALSIPDHGNSINNGGNLPLHTLIEHCFSPFYSVKTLVEFKEKMKFLLSVYPNAAFHPRCTNTTTTTGSSNDNHDASSANDHFLPFHLFIHKCCCLFRQGGWCWSYESDIEPMMRNLKESFAMIQEIGDLLLMANPNAIQTKMNHSNSRTDGGGQHAIHNDSNLSSSTTTTCDSSIPLAYFCQYHNSWYQELSKFYSCMVLYLIQKYPMGIFDASEEGRVTMTPLHWIAPNQTLVNQLLDDSRIYDGIHDLLLQALAQLEKQQQEGSVNHCQHDGNKTVLQAFSAVLI